MKFLYCLENHQNLDQNWTSFFPTECLTMEMLMSKLPLIVIIAHKSCHIYALHPPSVCLVPTINLNTENHTTFKLRGRLSTPGRA